MATILSGNQDFTTDLQSADILPQPKEKKNILQGLVDNSHEQEQKELEARRKEFLGKTDSDLLDFERYKPNEREAVRKQRLIRNVMDAEYDVIPKTSDSYQHARAQISNKMFGKVLDDETFFNKLQERAQTRKTRSDFQTDLSTNAFLDAVSGGANPYSKWNTKTAGHGGREKFKDALYLEKWNKTQDKIEEKYGDVLPVVRDMFRHMKGAEGSKPSEFFYQMSKEDRPVALNLLAVAARGLSEEKKATFLGNLKKQAERDVKRQGQSIVDGLKRFTVNASVGFSGDAGMISQGQMESAESGFRADLKRIIEQDYDPVKHLFEEGTFGGSAERAVYATPGVLASTATAVIPYVGQASVYFQMEDQAFQEYRYRFMQAGMTEEEAMEKASNLSIATGAIQGGLERIGGRAIMGKFPVLDKTFTALNDKITNRVARFGTKALINAGQETAIENLQDLTQEAVQDITHALNQDVPDVQWEEVFDGYAHQTLTTFLAVLPLSMFGAAGGINTERRNAAFSKASDLELLAIGLSQDSITGIREATGAESLSQAIESGQASINPRSESAKDATQELAEGIQKQKEIEAEALQAGVLPRVNVTKEGLEVVDSQTEELIGMAENADDAIQIMNDHTRLLDNAGSHRLLYLKSMIEGAQLTTKKDGEMRENTVELRLDEKTTVAQAAEESAGNFERMREQLDIRERMSGGDGSMTSIVLGQSSTEFEGKQRKTLNRLNGGASILDVVHEDAHGMFREAISTGRLKREETVDFFRAVDSALGDKTQNFLPDGEVSDVALDEAVAEFAEVELLRTRKGDKTGAKSIVNSNLSALGEIGKASGKFKSFISAMKEYFKTALTRHLHIKKALADGTLEEGKLDDFRAKLQGTTQQEEFEGEVMKVADTILKGEESSSISNLPVLNIDIEDVLNKRPGELRKFIVDTLLNEFKGQEITVAKSGHAIKMPESRSKAKQAAKSRNPKMEIVVKELRSIIEQSIHTHKERPTGDLKSSRNKNARFKDAVNVHKFEIITNINNQKFNTWFTAIENEGGELSFDSVGIKKRPKGNGLTNLEDSLPAQTGAKEEYTNTEDGATSFSIGNSQIADALIGDITERVRDPEARARVLESIISRLNSTKRDAVEIKEAFGKKYVQEPIVEPKTRTQLKKEQAKVKADIKKELQEDGWSASEAIEEADFRAEEWLENALTEQERDNNPMARLRRSLATLDAITMALPIELRGKVGGYTQIAKLNTDEARLNYLLKKVDKVDEVLDRWVADTTRKDIEKIFKRAKIKKDSKGIPKAKLAADYTDEIREAEEISNLTSVEKDSRIEEIQKGIDEAAESGQIEQITGLESDLAKVLAFGNLEKQNAQETITAFDNLQSLFSTGLILKEAMDEEFSVEIDTLKAKVNHDVTGGKGSVSPDQAKRMQAKREKKPLFHNMSKFHRKNLNFEWLLNALSRGNKEVGTLESETTKLLGREVHISTHAEKRGNMNTLKRYNAKMSDVFQAKGLKLSKEIDKFNTETDSTGVFVDFYEGGKKTIKKVLKANIVRRLINKEMNAEAVGLSQKEVSKAIAEYKRMEEKAKDGVVKDNRNINYEIKAPSKKIEKRLSQDQAINISMLWLQDDLRNSMEQEGFTKEAMKQIESFLSPEAKDVRDFLRNEYDQNYHDLNAVFKVMNGTNLPQNKNYSPAVRKADGVVKELAIDSAGSSAMTTSPNFLISRVKNFAQIDQTVGALSLYMGHMTQSQHYISWAKSVKKLRSIFGDKEIKGNIEAYAGRDLLSEIAEKIEWFADGGNRKASHYRALDKMRTTFTYASLAYNWGVAVKQLTSLPAYAWDMGAKDFAKYSLEFAKNPVENMKFIWGLDYTQARFKEGYERDVIEGLKGGGTWSEDLLQKGMLFGKAGDIVPVMAGGWVSYKRAYDKAIEIGMSKELAHKEAVLIFEMSTDRAQQAGDLKDFSTFQGGGSLFKLFTMFKTSPTQYYRNVYESLLDMKAGKKGSKKEFANRFIIGQIILPLTFQFASDAVSKLAGIAGDEDEFDGKDYLRAMLLGPLNGLFIAGDGLELLTSGIANAKIWSENITILDPFEKIGRGIQNLYDGDFAEGVDDIMRGAGKVAPSPLTFYEIFKRELNKLDLDE